ncbi:right-handed parallel beta-helix repeat-containing protein [Actinomycetospora aeridis]|uniref:Right-handed parallel beta-helix repeat-containing protein n=1 Tax=Actinomycetospora aeridis TaxID=3129231 RepID=A0ABU8N7J0_9PSEU
MTAWARRRPAAIAAAVVTAVVTAVALGGCASGTSAGPPADAASVVVRCANAVGDAASINEAIARSPEGAEIVLSGTCALSETITLRGDRAYRGESRTGTVLRQSDGADLPALLASDSWVDDDRGTGPPFTVRDMTLDGNRAGNTGSATDGLVIRSWKTSVEGLDVEAFGGSGIRVTDRSADGNALDSTQVNGRIVGNVITGSGRHGVQVDDSGNGVTDWQLADNWIADSGLDGVHVDNSAGWMINRNHVYGVGNNAIWADRLYGTTISDNYVEGFGEIGTGIWYGIGLQVNGGAASTVANNRVFALEGEREGSTYRYIGVARVNYGVGVLAVSGNTVRGIPGARGVGLYYSAGEGGGLDLTSVGNAVTDLAAPRILERNVTMSPGF